VIVVPKDVEKSPTRKYVKIPKGEDWSWQQCKQYILRGTTTKPVINRYGDVNDHTYPNMEESTNLFGVHKHSDLELVGFTQSIELKSLQKRAFEKDRNVCKKEQRKKLMLASKRKEPIQNNGGKKKEKKKEIQDWNENDEEPVPLLIHECDDTNSSDRDDYVMLNFARVLHHSSGITNPFFDEARVIPLQRKNNTQFKQFDNSKEVWKTLHDVIERLLRNKCGEKWVSYVKEMNKGMIPLRYFDLTQEHTKEENYFLIGFNSVWNWPMVTLNTIKEEKWPVGVQLGLVFDDFMFEMYCKYRFDNETADAIMAEHLGAHA